jgi:hypothetical protein
MGLIVATTVIDTARRVLGALRHPARAARLATGLWIVWAAIVWNVVLDRVIVTAGRQYIRTAGLADRGLAPYPRMDDWMRPAVTRGVWIATAAASAILAIGLLSIRAARFKQKL